MSIESSVNVGSLAGGIIEVSRWVFTGTLRDGRSYAQIWKGWELRSYHWIDNSVRQWLDMLIALGPVDNERAKGLAVYAGIPTDQVDTLMAALQKISVLQGGGENYDTDAYLPRQLNLGTLPHTATAGHFNREILDTNSPYFVKFEVNTTCNMRCGYCYVKEVTQEKVDLEKGIEMLRRLRRAGVIELSLTGLESTLHPEIHELVKFADQLGFRVALLTNGLKFRQELLETLRTCKRTEVRITYHSLDDEQFDSFTKVPRARKRVWQNLLRLKMLGIPVVATIVTNSSNEMLVERTTTELAEEEIPFVVSSIILSYVSDKLPSLASNAYLPSIGVLSSLIENGITTRDRKECTALRSKAWLAANGDLFPCELTRGTPIGNLLETELAELWGADASDRLRKHYGKEPSGCAGCSLKEGCPRCPALAEQENGHPDSAYTAFCDTTMGIASQVSGDVENKPGEAVERFEAPVRPITVSVSQISGSQKRVKN